MNQAQDDQKSIIIDDILSKIPQEWSDFLKTKNIYQKLRTSLDAAYTKYYNDGNWHVAPSHDRIFNWMACNPRNVRAIILLMEPIPDGPEEKYMSTGYALGVQRKHRYEGNILEIRTMSKWFKILHMYRDEVSWTDQAKAMMKRKYNDEFNPGPLSEKGILFLNASLTKGLKGTTDRRMWWPFLEDLLGNMEPAEGVHKIVVIQLYNNKDLQKFFESHKDKYSTYLPAFMRINGQEFCHVSGFNDRQIEEFYKGIKQEDHRSIMTEIAEEVINGDRR